MGLKILNKHRFPDHHNYQAADLQFNDDLRVESLPMDNFLFLKVSAQVDQVILDEFDQQLIRSAQRVQP